MSLTRVMNIATQAMANSKTGISTSSHNIANADTEGYSRQQVDVVTNHPIVRQGFTMGNGAKVRGIKRIHDDFVELQIRNDTTQKGKAQAQTYGMRQIENLFNEAIEKGISHNLQVFYGTLQRLSEDPDQGAIREMVKITGQDLCAAFNRTHSKITNIRKDVDEKIEGLINEINVLGDEIANLNLGIKELRILGKNANDFVDERNVKLKRLAEIIDIKVIENEDNTVMVRIANSGNLVDNGQAFELKTPKTMGLGMKNVLLLSPTGGVKDITKNISGGEIGGYFNVRDEAIVDVLDRLNTLSGTIITEFNEVHRQGYGLDGNTGVEFFKPLEVKQDEGTGELFYDLSAASEKMSLSDDILQRTAAIAAADEPSGVANNRNILQMLDVTKAKLMEDGTSTIEDYYNSLVGFVGLNLNRVKKNLEHQRGILNQLDTIRESVSGVSLDEETTELMKHQHNFDAAARLITVSDQLFDTVLNLKR